MGQVLPIEVQQRLDARQQGGSADLSTFGKIIAAMRDEAVKARKDSGIEDVWMYCEEAYVGIDDENRIEFARAKWAKPQTADGPLIARTNSSDGVRSTAFVRLTARYVDAATAKVGEITLPIDGKPFVLDPTPVPDLIAGLEDERPVVNAGVPVMRQPSEDEAAKGQGPVQLKVKDLAQKRMDEANKTAEAATNRINDWLVEGHHIAQMRKVEHDMARIGVGVIKGPVPHVTKAKAVTSSDQGVTLAIVQKRAPRTVWVDPWNFFPSGDCGEDIHSGGAVFERDFLSAKALRKLKDQPGYIAEAIDKALEEGPNKAYLDNSVNPGERKESARFIVWYAYCEITKDQLSLVNSQEAAAAGEKQSVFAIITLVNDSVIKGSVNPLDSGSFPYRVASWRRRSGHWAGVGVAEQCKLPQRGVNSATRALFNNAGKSAGAQIVVNRSRIEPADGRWQFTPDKVWWDNDDTGSGDARAAFMAYTIPNATPQLLSIIEYQFRLAEESTNIPLVTQGFSGDTTPDTFGATQIQNTNATQLLRDVGYTIADDLTNPLIEDFYEWLLLDPDVPNEEKGDFQVNCNAAAVMIERAIQDQTIMQMAPMVVNPAFGFNPKLWAAEMMRTKRLNPESFQYTEDELAKMAENQTPPPQIQVAQIRAQSAEKIAQGKDQVTVEKTKADIDRDTAYTESLSRRDEASANLKLEELRLKVQLAQLDYANAERISLQEAKVKLADTSMKLNLQRELAGADGKGPQVATPIVEPEGRAPDGRAYAE